MTVSAKSGKVVIRIRDRQCTLEPTNATKIALKIHDAAARAAKQAKRFQGA